MKTRFLILFFVLVVSIVVFIWGYSTEYDCDGICIDNETNHNFDNLPEVMEFYARYNDADVSIKDDHVSYFAGNGDDYRARMNLYFDKDSNLDHMEFLCYVGGQLKHEVPQEDILHYLQNYHCLTGKLVK